MPESYKEKENFKLNELYYATITPVYYKKNFGKEFYRTAVSRGYKTICYKVNDEEYYDIINDMVFKSFANASYKYIDEHYEDYFETDHKPLFMILNSRNINLDDRELTTDEIKSLCDIINKRKQQKQPESQETRKRSFKKRKLRLENPFSKQVLNVMSEIPKDFDPKFREKYIQKLNTISNSYFYSLIEHYDSIKKKPEVELDILNQYITLLEGLRYEIKKEVEFSKFSDEIVDEKEILEEALNSQKLN